MKRSNVKFDGDVSANVETDIIEPMQKKIRNEERA
jgi:hypothetical protein